MTQVRAFVALVAPWLAAPGDEPISRLVVAVVLTLVVVGALTVGYGGIAVVREILPSPQREVVQ